MALSTGAAIAGASAAAAYLNGKYHITKDVTDIWRQKRAERRFANMGKAQRWSLWYLFEEQAQRMPALQQCIWSRAGSYTWKETYDMSCRYAQFYLSQGLQPGELVAFYLTNSPEFMFAYVGSWAVGSAPAMVNYNLSGDALIHCLKLSGSRLVLVDEDAECRIRIEDVRDRIENELGMKIVILSADTRRSIGAIPAKRPEDRYRESMTGTFPMCLIYTSGTTGMPKACPFQVQRAWHITHYRSESHGLQTGANADRWYDTMPLYHGTGNTVAVGCLCTGTTLCIGKKFSVSRFWDDVRDSEATCFVYVGETARYLLNAPPTSRDKDNKIRLMYGNGLRPDVWQKFQERFGIDTVSEFFNSTEGVFALANLNRNDYTAAAVGHHGAIRRWQTKNAFIPVAIDHEKGDIYRDPKTGFAKRVPYEEGGELIVNIPTEAVFSGYWNAPEATKKKFLYNVFKMGDLYYRTGDALRRTDDGRWYFMDRLGDTFRWKSENVSTAEVSQALGLFPGVQEANVYGVELPAHDGRAGCAALFIAPEQRDSFDFKGLLLHSRKTLPKYAVPIFLRIIHEQQLGHNNKQNKVPLRNEGIDPQKISTGKAGPNDAIYWCPPKGDTYVPFGPAEYASLHAGKARL